MLVFVAGVSMLAKTRDAGINSEADDDYPGDGSYCLFMNPAVQPAQSTTDE